MTEIGKLSKDLEIASEKRATAITDFIKTILLLLSTVLAVLITLYSKSTSCIEIVCFIITIILFALNILFGSLLLYADIDSLMNVEKLRSKRFGEAKQGIQPTSDGEYTESKSIHNYYWLCFKINSIVSLVMIVVYSIVKVIGA